MTPNLTPGEISVTYRDDVTPDQRKAFEQSIGLPEPIGEPRIMCTYIVPEEHEKFWVLVLNDPANARIVQYAAQSESPHRPADRTMGAHREVAIQKPFKMVSGSFAEMLDARINEYFRDTFAGVATVKVLRRGDNFIQLSSDDMKGQIIAKPRYWEKLDIYAVFFQDKGRARLYVDYDGYFATGISSKPPPYESYSNMDPTFGRELSRYADVTTTELASYLKKEQ